MIVPLSFSWQCLESFYFSRDLISLGYSELRKSKLSGDILKSSWLQGGLMALSDHVKQSVQGIRQREAGTATSSGNSQSGS